MKLSELKSMVREIPDFPKPGINFKDITPILKDAGAFKYVINRMAKKFKGKGVTVVASAESRGFIFGAALAYKLKAGFVPLRKPGKLPYKTLKEEYKLEYGTDAFEIHVDGIHGKDKVLIVDDVLATGGTMRAAVNLVEKLEGKVAGIALLSELEFLKGREKLNGYEVYSLIRYK